jgi:hypothetical protein
MRETAKKEGESMKVFPVEFTEPTDERIVVVDQTHHEQFADTVRQSTVNLTITYDGEKVIIPIIATHGRKTANAQLTLSIGETRELIGYLERAITDAEDSVRYAETEAKKQG